MWYENTNGETASWINADGSSRFPLTIKELDRTLKTYTTKQQFIDDIVIPAINEFNNKIPGYGFFYRSTYGSSDSLWDSDDGTSVIQIYRQSSGDGGGMRRFIMIRLDTVCLLATQIVLLLLMFLEKNGIFLRLDMSFYIIYSLIIRTRER